MRKRDVVLLILLLGLIFFLQVYYDQPRDESGKRHAIRYDCSIAEINPDYPIEVKQKCREMLEKANNVQN